MRKMNKVNHWRRFSRELPPCNAELEVLFEFNGITIRQRVSYNEQGTVSIPVACLSFFKKHGVDLLDYLKWRYITGEDLWKPLIDDYKLVTRTHWRREVKDD